TTSRRSWRPRDSSRRPARRLSRGGRPRPSSGSTRGRAPTTPASFAREGRGLRLPFVRAEWDLERLAESRKGERREAPEPRSSGEAKRVPGRVSPPSKAGGAAPPDVATLH